MKNNKIRELAKTYESVVKVVDKKAFEDEERAYGGVVRSVKGKLQEYLTEEIIKIAWTEVGGNESRLEINSKKQKIKIRREYINKIEEIDIKNHILENITNYYYGLSIDKQVFIDGKFVIGIECKAYTENAMIKRILVDFSLLKTNFPELHCYLFQLESQLGGDYCKLNKVAFGSTSTHTLMSYFPRVKLNIYTFLKGERKVDHPIHKFEYFKPLEISKIKGAINLLANDLNEFV